MYIMPSLQWQAMELAFTAAGLGSVHAVNNQPTGFTSILTDSSYSVPNSLVSGTALQMLIVFAADTSLMYGTQHGYTDPRLLCIPFPCI